MSDVNDFLNSSSGENHPAFKFAQIGALVKGEIVETPKVLERASLRDGKPEKQLVIALNTGAEIVSVWVRQGFLAGAVAEAIRKAGADGLEVGGQLAVKYTEDRDTGKALPAKVYAAEYKAPAPSAVSVDDVFGGTI